MHMVCTYAYGVHMHLSSVRTEVRGIKNPFYKEQWLLIDTTTDPSTPIARFAHKGETELPGTGGCTYPII